MRKIYKEEDQKRLDKITELFSDMVQHADELSTHRCPYKNRCDECTAKFGCRNQRKPSEDTKLLLCVGDDKLDYRSAWETDPVDEADIWLRNKPSDGDDISRR